jgi:hypothetical protein
MSLRPSRFASPDDCSGDMYEGVPIVSPDCVIESELVDREMARASPKSATSTLPSESRMLPGLISRWMTP